MNDLPKMPHIAPAKILPAYRNLTITFVLPVSLALLIAFGALLIFIAFHPSGETAQQDHLNKYDMFSDGFKTLLGVVIGVLASMSESAIRRER
jgi:L-asparagine transporter-like permease